MFTSIFVGMGTFEDGDSLSTGGERDGTDNPGSGLKGGIHDFGGRFVDDAVIKRFEFDSDSTSGHYLPFNIY